MTTITEEATEEVMVKPLDFKPVEGVKGVFDAQSMLGYYRVDDTFQTPTAGGMKTVLPSWMGPAPAGYRHEYASIDEAFAAAQADYEARIRSALVAPQAEGRDTGLREALRRIAGGHHPALGALVIAGDWRAAFGILQDIAKDALSPKETE